MEREVEDKVQNYIKDDIILNEKMTPQFLRLAKNNKSEPMSCIKNGDGIKFNSINDRGEYIRSFFEQLYTVPDTAPLDFRGCVRDFLGEEICNNTVVRGMILTEPEKTRLDQPITLEELDEALASSNKRSAPGIDGVSNRLITAIWSLVRRPLLRYADCCFRKGRLTNTFKTACIKLIPKKGDLTLVKNWRPISLLSCYYKIISRVINSRLGQVINKVTGRSQQAYNNKRHIHEVVINLHS